MKITALSLLIFIVLAACNTSSKIQLAKDKQPGDNLNINIDGDAVDKIVFLTFEVTLADSVNDFYKFTLKKKKFAPGALKKDRYDDETSMESNYFYYQVSAEGQKQVNFQKIQNPLLTIYEYPGENSSLGKKLIEKRSGELVVRFNYNKDTRYISFYKINPNTKVLKPIYHALL